MVRIAIVEDEAVSRQLLADYIARYSEENNVPFEVTYFEDGGAIIGDYKPVYDIILMDIQMTHVDGMTAARAIREVDQEVVLVFITSAAQFAIHGYQEMCIRDRFSRCRGRACTPGPATSPCCKTLASPSLRWLCRTIPCPSTTSLRCLRFKDRTLASQWSWAPKATAWVDAPSPPPTTPVSYTHLDVYKRQVPS